MRTFGVEEELLIVDPASGEPLALADALLAGSANSDGGSPEESDDADSETPEGHPKTRTGLSHELKLEQIETQTRPCHSYSGLLRQIRRGRTMASDAARKHGARIAALATSPVDSATHTTPDPRYAMMLERFGITAHEQLTCGFHVHTSIESPEEGVVVLDRIRDKLAVLTAISANSPYWRGLVTGFESYRTQAWNRWPSSGPTAVFGSLASYRRLVSRLIDTGVLLDEGMVYFDARLSRNNPTVEVRVADVCLRSEDAALIAVLVRALVETAVREAESGIEPSSVPSTLLRMASWQASNFGLRNELLDFGTFRPAPAADVVWSLVEYLEPVLAEQGELDLAQAGIGAILQRGNGAMEQRRIAGVHNGHDGDRPDAAALAAVVRHAVRETMPETAPESDTTSLPVLTWVRQDWRGAGGYGEGI
ncbi:carboxylate--amine ligase [Arthrobacter sp. SW1]|uniref:glutamate--cysteine ligase 2 n=1 Tax=Arthrobacter sp. SW1 TaxID=1920889 RepID=UPI000877B1F1|nr:glutamate--cysteine ligase [Arthrobacter sp. SW1]OFI36795.1 carboxylate--amine ligase [Arthrobacter sp. SW1]